MRHSLYDLDGEHFWTKDQSSRYVGFSEYYDIKSKCPSVSFEFSDFDGERITARTLIEEREWHFGSGWFRWLSLFCKPKIKRSLDIEFSKETGRRKGSWKGGTIGHGIEMLPNEKHAGAFARYCAEHEMELIK